MSSIDAGRIAGWIVKSFLPSSRLVCSIRATNSLGKLTFLHHDGQTSSIKVKLVSNQFDRTGQRAV
jgi:hypothetical protein